MSDRDARTASREALTEAWQAALPAIDWMHVPGMAEYVNGMVSGKPLARGGHWAEHARDAFVLPLSKRLARPLRMVSLGCGSGRVERALLEEFGWPIGELLGLEYDAELRRSAEEGFAGLALSSRFCFYDFNAPAPDLAGETFDLVFACHSIHHATDVEGLLAFVNGLMTEDSLFVGIDYFGPTRFQVEHEVRAFIRNLHRILPDELRRDLRFPDRPADAEFPFATIADVAGADPSEAVRSSDLRTLLFSNFPVVESRPMGGTLLRWLLQNRAGNYDARDPNHVAIARLLQFVERTLIAYRVIRSDDLFFVLRRSPTLAVPARRGEPQEAGDGET